MKSERRFPAPSTVEDMDGSFIVEAYLLREGVAR